MNGKFTDIKNSLCDKSIYYLLVPSVFNPTPERLLNRAEKYQADDKVKVYAYLENGEYKGVIVFKIEDNTAEILDISVKPEYRGKGIGSRLIDYIFSQFAINKITTETDDDAIGFYKKYGFTVADTKDVFDSKRYICVCESVSHHYDLLIDEGNDPVHDPKSLRDYMDKWDGQGFIDNMELDKNKSVLEIGVGTGRLAVRIAPFNAVTIKKGYLIMAENRSISQNDLGISLNRMESLARILLPILQEYLASEEGQKDFEEWQKTHSEKDGSKKPPVKKQK